ncbi:hypothetical protein AX15_005586 [Amanita polypyramis BW_CC]|nr:hypothetical protein AX15_005586 [Amanita polypyramis BW_CC]
MGNPELHTYTALIVPTVTSHVSIQTIQWTSDGQLCLSTKAAAHIMTPDHGINFDTSSVIRPSQGAKDKDAGMTIGWFRTVIQIDKISPMKWPEHCQEWGTLSLGSMDPTLLAVIFSPSGLSSEAGCIAATLSSNMDLCLWAPAKHSLKGEWKNIVEVTPLLLEHLLSSEMQGSEDKIVHVLKAQIVSIIWSQQCNFGLEPSPVVDSSLLIAGNRAGSLVFFRFFPETQSIQIVYILDVGDKWVTHIAITSWKTTTQGQCESYLAYGTADGAIGVVKIRQQLSELPSLSQLFESREHGITLTVEELPLLVYEPDQSGVTALQWIDISDTDRILIHCTPGRAHLHYPSLTLSMLSSPSTTPSIAWRTHSLRLKTYRTSTASSAFHPPSGISYLPTYDRLIVTLSDGSINVLHGLNAGRPHLVDDSQNMPSGEISGRDRLAPSVLSTNVRSMFVRNEKGEVDKHDMNKITGMTGYDPNDGVFVWSYEIHRPGDFSYKHDSKQKSVLFVANLWDSDGDLNVVYDLERALGHIKASSGRAPLDILRPILFSLRNGKKLNMAHGKKLNMAHGKILEVLSQGITHSDDMAMSVALTSNLGKSRWKGKGRADAAESEDTSVKRGFRKSISKHLFGWDAIANWRAKLGLADYIWKLSGSTEEQAACGVIAQSLLNAITHHLYRTLVRHVLIASPFLTPADVPFARRLSVVAQTLLGGVTSADLVTDVQQFLDAVKDVAVEERTAKEVCPACHVEVPLADARGAVCANGHVWTRCSMTTFILSTAFVRTCIGCKRKAFLAPSAMTSVGDEEGAKVQHLPALARGWVVQELLEAVQRCLFCGNAFVCIA